MIDLDLFHEDRVPPRYHPFREVAAQLVRGEVTLGYFVEFIRGWPTEPFLQPEAFPQTTAQLMRRELTLPPADQDYERTSRGKWICPLCRTTWAGRFWLERHLALPHTPCGVCGRTFLRRGGLAQHQQRMHRA